MDIDRLRYFVVLANSSTMREAAEHLHISQPALSKAMKVLEEELQEQLFVSSGRRMLITDKGRVIAAKAQKIINDLEKITHDSSLTEKNQIRIGSFEVFTTYFLGTLASQSLEGFHILLRELTPGDLEEHISMGAIDIGITYLPIPNDKLEFIKVTEIEMGLYANSKTFDKSEFNQWPFVVPVTPVRGVPHKVKGLDGWPDNKIPRNIKYKVDLMETALELCRRGLAVAYLPKFIVELHNKQIRPEFMLKPLPSPKKLKQPRQPVYVVKRRTDIESLAFKQIANALRNIADKK